MLSYDFDPKATYLAACSYGSDSMSLLDMMQKDGVKPIVCFVNYHIDPESDDDERNLRAYCLEKGLTMEVLDCSALPEEKKNKDPDNFKSWAREARYGFFTDMMEKYHGSALFIAHQQDDLLETYLLQKQHKKSGTATYGYSKVATVRGIIVVRPLLNYSKQDLLEYDQENHVPYSVKQNESLEKYTHDPIMMKINQMSEIERSNIIEEMNAANSEATLFMKSLSEKISQGEELNIREIMCLDSNEFAETIIKYVHKSRPRVKISAATLQEIRKMALSPLPNASLKLADNIFLIKEYDVLTIGTDINELPYCLTLEKPGKLSNEHFDLDFSNGAEDRGIKKEDYPLTIRTALPGDNYIVHGYLTPVRRLYIDWKMPPEIRCIWPIVVASDGRIVSIPRYNRLDRGDYKKEFTSILDIKLPAID